MKLHLPQLTHRVTIIIIITNNAGDGMHSSANVEYPTISLVLFCSCDKIYHKQEVRFLCLLGQFVTCQWTVPHNFKAPLNAVGRFFFDLVKACEGVFFLCFKYQRNSTAFGGA